MVASLIFIVLLRFLAGIMVWVMIVMVILVLGYGEQGAGSLSWASPRFPFPVFQWDLQKFTLRVSPPCPAPGSAFTTGIEQFSAFFAAGIFHCYMEYAKLKGEAGSDVSLVDLGFQTDLRVYLHLRQTWLAFRESPSSSGIGVGPGTGHGKGGVTAGFWAVGGSLGKVKVAKVAPLPLAVIILCVLELVIILLLIFLRKRILIAIALIKEASRSGCPCPHGLCHPSFRGLTGL